MRVVSLLNAILLCFTLIGSTNAADTQWYQQNDSKQVRVRVDLFLSTTCPNCIKAKQFFNDIALHEPWLDIHSHFINKDRAALDAFSVYVQQQPQHLNNYSVPALFFCNSQWVGFVSAKTTGRKLLESLNYCRQQIMQSGSLSANTVNVLRQWASASWYESAIKKEYSPFLFLSLMSVMDALTPCAIFCIVALFSFVLFQEGWGRRMGLSLLLLLVATAVHYLQQAYTPLYYEWLSWLRIPAGLTGLALVVFLGWYRRMILSDRCFSKRSWCLFILAVLTILMVQAYQQDCTPGFALIFRQWLPGQDLSPMQQWMYSLIYPLFYYVISGLLMLLFILGITSGRAVHYRKKLLSIAWAVLVVISLVLLIYPAWLSQLLFSFAMLGIAILAGWLISVKNDGDFISKKG